MATSDGYGDDYQLTQVATQLNRVTLGEGSIANRTKLKAVSQCL